MLKRTVIVGLLLSLGGGGLLAWLVLTPQATVDPDTSSTTDAFTDTNAGIPISANNEWASLSMDSNEALDSELTQLRKKSPELQAAEKRARLLDDIEKLAAGNVPEVEMGNMLYGPHWQSYVETYRREQENREIMLTVAVVVSGLGVATVTLSIVAGLIRLLTTFFGNRRKTPRDEGEVKNARTSAAIQDITSNGDLTRTDPLSQRTKLDTKRKSATRSKVSVDIQEEIHDPEVLEVANYNRVYPNSDEAHEEIGFSHSSSAIQNLLSDEPEETLPGSDEPILGGAKTTPKEKPPKAPARKKFPVNPQSDVRKNGASKATTTTLEQQIAQVAELAHDVKTDDSESSEPVNETLQILNEQISAIRHYASTQQDRVEKLQSGYDWNIIRTFCVRVIRCIDNLENRMERCDASDLEQTLSEVHDELLFSLESSGVEQFAPELNSAFCGQERVAEAVKAKAACPKSEFKGCIAEIIKPGYQYVIDEQNVKIVRTARVKLYGSDNSPTA